jgi:hypothetical protein
MRVLRGGDKGNLDVESGVFYLSDFPEKYLIKSTGVITYFETCNTIM